MTRSQTLLLACGCLISALLSAQSTTITFSATIDGEPVAIDSIGVKNVTASRDTMLYTPDTVLVLDFRTGLTNVLLETGTEFNMGQAAPNPFDGSTHFDVDVQDAGVLSLTIYDALGKVLSTMERNVGRGAHIFSYSGGTPGVTFAEARWKGQRIVQRLLNMSGGQQPALRYIGWNEQVAGRAKDGWFTWESGDSLFYIIYATSPYGYIFSAAAGEDVTGPSTPLFDLLPGLVCADSPVVEDIDGNIYPAVQIGDQCWMAENLKTSRYNDDTSILNGTDSATWVDEFLNTGVWCNYDNDMAYDPIYGKLYNGAAAQNMNICPFGWHVPSDLEWMSVETTLGISVDQLSSVGQRGLDLSVGGKMKATNLWNSPNLGANDASGFSAIPGGLRHTDGIFGYIEMSGVWWSTSIFVPGQWGRRLEHDQLGITRYNYPSNSGFSIRCVRNTQDVPPVDCNGVPNGTAYFDDCNMCVGGNTGIAPNSTCIQDCNGVWGGVALIDDCDTCVGGTTGLAPCIQDCAGIWGGSALPGTPCDDNDAGTISDVYGTDCVCAGQEDVGCGTAITDIDGNIYSVVQIGDQCWMAANLRATRYRDGSNIPNTTGQTSWYNLTSGAWSNYGNNPNNDGIYGKLYNGFSAADPNICPLGWHVPTDAEWMILETALGMPADQLDTIADERGSTQNVGGKMKTTGIYEQGTGLWNSPNIGATNESGFSALPGGGRNEAGAFFFLRTQGNWWSAPEVGSDIAMSRHLMSYSLIESNSGISRLESPMRMGNCIRCVRDQ